MLTCAVYGCTNSLTTNPDPGIQYHYFPKHPVFTQQWITACWRADAIDIDNSQICSIHFDNNSYSSEFKVLDYLGHYTRMLKYDAVPTLYLPNPPQQVILKNTVQQQPITLNITNTIHQNDIKNLVIYDVQDVTFEANVSHQQTLIPMSSELKFLNISIPTGNSPSEEDDKFDIQQLLSLKNENKTLKQNITKVEDTIKRLEIQLSEKSEVLNTKDEELKGFMKEYDILRRSRMKYADQKSILSKVFSESQLKILSGKKKIYWSNDDMAMGYTIWNLSNKRCYMYLTKTLNIPLPALSSIRRWATIKRLESIKEEIKNDK